MFEASGYGTDCYPGKYRRQEIGLEDMNDAFLFNPRSCCQNYNVAVNISDKPIYTYLGKLKPRIGNANYCSAGQLSPLFNDPLCQLHGMHPPLPHTGAGRRSRIVAGVLRR